MGHKAGVLCKCKFHFIRLIYLPSLELRLVAHCECFMPIRIAHHVPTETGKSSNSPESWRTCHRRSWSADHRRRCKCQRSPGTWDNTRRRAPLAPRWRDTWAPGNASRSSVCCRHCSDNCDRVPCSRSRCSDRRVPGASTRCAPRPQCSADSSRPPPETRAHTRGWDKWRAGKPRCHSGRCSLCSDPAWILSYRRTTACWRCTCHL